MNKLLILDVPLLTVWAYPDRKILHHQMKAFCYGAEFRDALHKIADAMERYHLGKYLADNRAGGAVTREDADWARKNFLPRALAAGWKHWAIVQPASVIGQINMKRHAVASLANSGLIARMFGDPAEAMRWLESV